MKLTLVALGFAVLSLSPVIAKADKVYTCSGYCVGESRHRSNIGTSTADARKNLAKLCENAESMLDNSRRIVCQ